MEHGRSHWGQVREQFIQKKEKKGSFSPWDDRMGRTPSLARGTLTYGGTSGC